MERKSTSYLCRKCNALHVPCCQKFVPFPAKPLGGRHTREKSMEAVAFQEPPPKTSGTHFMPFQFVCTATALSLRVVLAVMPNINRLYVPLPLCCLYSYLPPYVVLDAMLRYLSFVYALSYRDICYCCFHTAISLHVALDAMLLGGLCRAKALATDGCRPRYVNLLGCWMCCKTVNY
jgi:hypothetical protein